MSTVLDPQASTVVDNSREQFYDRPTFAPFQFPFIHSVYTTLLTLDLALFELITGLIVFGMSGATESGKLKSARVEYCFQ